MYFTTYINFVCFILMYSNLNYHLFIERNILYVHLEAESLVICFVGKQCEKINNKYQHSDLTKYSSYPKKDRPAISTGTSQGFQDKWKILDSITPKNIGPYYVLSGQNMENLFPNVEWFQHWTELRD